MDTNGILLDTNGILEDILYDFNEILSRGDLNDAHRQKIKEASSLIIDILENKENLREE